MSSRDASFLTQGEVQDCCVCSKPSTQICSRCKMRQYCSKSCQMIDWKQHKQYCKAPRIRDNGDPQQAGSTPCLPPIFFWLDRNPPCKELMSSLDPIFFTTTKNFQKPQYHDVLLEQLNELLHDEEGESSASSVDAVAEQDGNDNKSEEEEHTNTRTAACGQNNRPPHCNLDGF